MKVLRIHYRDFDVICWFGLRNINCFRIYIFCHEKILQLMNLEIVWVRSTLESWFRWAQKYLFEKGTTSRLKVQNKMICDFIFTSSENIWRFSEKSFNVAQYFCDQLERSEEEIKSINHQWKMTKLTWRMQESNCTNLAAKVEEWSMTFSSWCNHQWLTNMMKR